jgi:5'/3'-nucleotidase SurE
VFAATSGAIGAVDLCISGINAGENLGAELTVSGTFGAALECYSYQIPAIAISRQYGGTLGSDPTTWDWAGTDAAAASAIAWCMRQGDWRMANVNLPNTPASDEPVASKVSAQSYFRNRYLMDTHEIHSEFQTDRTGVLPTDDIHVFETLSRISVSFIDEIAI